MMQVPFTGSIMVALNLVIYIAVRILVPRTGSIATVGLITSLIRFVTTPGFSITPGFAILMESLVAEVILSVMGVNRISAIVSGAALQLFVIVFRLLSTFILYGWEMRKTFFATANIILPPSLHGSMIWAVIFFAGLFALIGAGVGWISYSIAGRLVRSTNHTLEKKAKIETGQGS